MAADLRGTEILAYRIEEIIGRGGMASVWRAENRAIRKEVAIKVLDPHLADDERLRERFRIEAMVQVSLEHENIVAVENFCLEPLAMVMKYVKGRDLARVIGREVGPIPMERALPWMQQILAAVAHAHGAGVVHRDLKPANILVAEDGVVKVMDFGIAKVVQDTSFTRTGVTLGTAAYMAPEQIKGAGKVDARADIYSLGATFYEMLAGRPPFEPADDGDLDFQLKLAHLQQEPEDPRQFYPAIPGMVVGVLMKALAKDPAKRYQTALEFSEALQAAARGRATPTIVEDGEQTGHWVSHEIPTPPHVTGKPGPWLWAAGLIVALLVGVVVVMAVGTGDEKPIQVTRPAEQKRKAPVPLVEQTLEPPPKKEESRVGTSETEGMPDPDPIPDPPTKTETKPTKVTRTQRPHRRKRGARVRKRPPTSPSAATPPKPEPASADPGGGIAVVDPLDEAPAKKGRTASSVPSTRSKRPQGSGDAELEALITAAEKGRTAPTKKAPAARPPPKAPAAPKGLTRTQVSRGMRRANPSMRICRRRFQTVGVVTIRATISNDGKIGKATVVGPFAGQPVGECVRAAVRASCRFPVFSGPSVTVKYPFVLR